MLYDFTNLTIAVLSAHFICLLSLLLLRQRDLMTENITQPGMREEGLVCAYLPNSDDFVTLTHRC